MLSTFSNCQHIQFRSQLDQYLKGQDKLKEQNGLLRIQIKNIEGRALNFSSKLIKTEVQLGLEIEKNKQLEEELKNQNSSKEHKNQVDIR